jgi:hypothetical protein
MAGRRARHAAVWLVAVVVQVGRVQAQGGPPSPPPPPPPCTLSCGSHGSPSSGYKPCRCNCRSGWSGDKCGHATGCDGNPNCGHGSCVANGGSHSCSCNRGWSGDTCGHPTGCDDTPCAHGGTCTAQGGQHTCACINCWSGAQSCDHPTGCDGVGCGHGSCSANTPSDPCGHTCNCNTGWSGTSCGTCKPAYTCPPTVPVPHSSSTCSDGSPESTCLGAPPCRASCAHCYKTAAEVVSGSASFTCKGGAWDGSLT